MHYRCYFEYHTGTPTIGFLSYTYSRTSSRGSLQNAHSRILCLFRKVLRTPVCTTFERTVVQPIWTTSDSMGNQQVALACHARTYAGYWRVRKYRTRSNDQMPLHVGRTPFTIAFPAINQKNPPTHPRTRLHFVQATGFGGFREKSGERKGEHVNGENARKRK